MCRFCSVRCHYTKAFSLPQIYCVLVRPVCSTSPAHFGLRGRLVKVTPDGRSYVLAAQNAIGDRNSVKLGGLNFTDTLLLGYSFLKNQPDSMRDNRATSCKPCTWHWKMGVHVTPFVVRAIIIAGKEQLKRCMPPKPLNLLFSTFM